MTVKAGDKVLATNYTTRSIAKNYVKAYTHSNSSATVDGSSYFQNMYVFFTAPESGKVTLTLSKAAGEGDTYFDDVRIVENDSKNITTNEKGEVVKFEQDFEKSVQGLYPFVVAGIEGVEDNRTTEIGRLGETAVCRQLEQQGYSIVRRNFCVRGGEIDIIAENGEKRFTKGSFAHAFHIE